MKHTTESLAKMRAELPTRKCGRLQPIMMGERVGRFSVWICQCDCGKFVSIREAYLVNGHTKSCGCINSERARAGLFRKHGMINTPTYYSWRSMRRRVLVPSTPGYERYGGRGITICKRWDEFKNFFADMGERPVGTTLDRKDSNGNYEPSNCRWATPLTQAHNRSTNVFAEFRGEKLCASEWAVRIGTYPQKILRRIKSGLPLDLVNAKTP